MSTHRLSRLRALAQSLAVMAGAILVTLLVAELLVRFMRPQDSMYPRWQYSAAYGFTLYPGRTMIHEKPGRWRFLYTVNDLGYRGPAVPMAESYDRTNIVVLGDSYAFGTGVNDGEEFASVLADSLAGTHDVINLGVGGWGLSQEIRKYYEFGALYDPGFIIVQYCENDLRDNVRNAVTSIEDGRFAFHDSASTTNWVKRFLSDSILQRSQLYNLFRQPLALRAATRDIARQTKRANPPDGQTPSDQLLYADLLEAFARDLHEGGRTLILIQVDSHMDTASYLKTRVARMVDEGLLVYCDVERGLEGTTGFSSPEGHRWGRVAHEVIGKELARTIVRLERGEPGPVERP